MQLPFFVDNGGPTGRKEFLPLCASIGCASSTHSCLSMPARSCMSSSCRISSPSRCSQEAGHTPELLQSFSPTETYVAPMHSVCCTPSTTRTMLSRVGPKSHDCSCFRRIQSSLFFWLLAFSMITHGTAAAVDARVVPQVRWGALPSGYAWGEATGQTAHYLFSRDNFHSGLQPVPPNGRSFQVRKRAFARAVRRASQAADGSTIYRGRRCFLRGHYELTVRPNRTPPAPLTGSLPTRRALRPRLRTLTLNVGSLDSTTFDTLMQWLPSCPYDAVCLQEIHHGLGRESTQWAAAGWRFITSVDPKIRFQGVAVLLRESLCREGELHFQEVIVGRLLHVRLTKAQHSIDIIGLYQHALHTEADSNNLALRHKLWNKLGLLLHNLPRRNLLLLMGDFNCTPEFVQGSMSVAYSESSKYPDADELAGVIEAHGLVVLNGWTRRCRQHTFVGAKHQSIIDFVLTRRHHADGLARQARVLPSINFSPWRLGGRHLAVIASIPLHPGWTGSSPKRTQPPTQYNKLQLDGEARQGGPRIESLRTALREYLARTPDCEPALINRFLLDQVILLFPKAA